MDGQHIVLEKDRVHILRTIFLWRDTAYQRLGVRNYGDRAVDLRLSILFENDFADLFEVRGAHRERRGTATAKLHGNDQVAAELSRPRRARCGAPTLTFDPPPDQLTTNTAVYDLHLAPGETRPIFLAVSCDRDQAHVPLPFLRGLIAARREMREADPRADIGRNLERALQRNAVPFGRRSRDADDRYAAGPLSLCRHPLVSRRRSAATA